MKFLGNIDELKDIVTKNHVDKMAGKQFMYPIYLPSSADTPISDEQKAVNKEAFDAYAEYVARDYADPYICLYVADMPKNMLVLPFESLNDNGELASLEVFGNISMFGGYSGIESMYNLFFGGTIMPDGSVVNVEDANLAFEVPTINSFKTINGKSIIGTGDIVIDGGIQTEEDPVFKASPAAKITDSNITNWNKAEANVQSDWNATDSSSDAYIKNKPTIPAAVTESTVSGWGFTKNTGTYVKPSAGIPKTDLASSVQASLDKADTALQSVKTINGESIIGTGDIVIDGGSDIDVSLLATKAELAEAEEVYAAAVNQLNIRIMALEAALRNM